MKLYPAFCGFFFSRLALVYLLFNAIVSCKENKCFKSSAYFYYSPLYCAMPILNENIRAFNLDVGSLKLRSFYFVAYTCIGILFLP